MEEELLKDNGISPWGSDNKYLFPKTKKDRQGAIPNRSFHRIQRVKCDFLPEFVAFVLYFQLFLSESIKKNHADIVSISA